MTLRLTSFGVRGFVGESLTPAVAMDFASAFATFLDGGRVLVGRDTRTSSPMLHDAVVSSLLAGGCDVLDHGICPSPILQFCVPRAQARGAIVISGGHHGMGWNSLTLVGADGALLEPVGGETVLDIFHAGAFRRAAWDGLGAQHEVVRFATAYFDALEQAVDAAAIRAAGYTVLIDPVGGAGCAFLDEFARRFGVRLVAVNAQPSGYLAREAEPRPRSALPMAAFIRHVKGDAGFVLSSDMGRLSLVTETGEPASEEYTLALIADHVLRRRPGPVVTNCCTTRMVDDLCRAKGAPLTKTPVGQAFVAAAMADEQAVLGGEGSGGVSLASFSPAFDGFLMMTLALQAMALSGRRLSELLADLPRYHMVKRAVPCDARRGYAAVEELKNEWAGRGGAEVGLTDGLRLDWDDGWVHIRNSRTEQVVRVISESSDREIARGRSEEIVRRVETAA